MPVLQLPAGPRSPRAARAFVADWLERWGYRQFEADAAVVTSELATNAVVHTGQPFEISIEDEQSGVRITVYDRSHDLPQLTEPDLAATSGRGLAIVASLASSWGMRPIDGDGKRIWATFGPARQLGS